MVRARSELARLSAAISIITSTCHHPQDTNNEVYRDFGYKHEANVAALRTIVKLLERLRLQPLDSSSGDDATHAVSRRYLRLQNVLLQGLTLDRDREGSVRFEVDSISSILIYN